MRSSSRQFVMFTRAEAQRFLASAPKMAETYGDRVAAERRLLPVTTLEERLAVRAYNARHGYDTHGQRIPRRTS